MAGESLSATPWTRMSVSEPCGAPLAHILLCISNIWQRNRLNREIHGVWLVRIDFIFFGFQIHQDPVFADDIFLKRPIPAQLVDDCRCPGPGISFRVVKCEGVLESIVVHAANAFDDMQGIAVRMPRSIEPTLA